MEPSLIDALPIDPLLKALIGVVVAFVGWTVKRYLGERSAALVVEMLRDVAPRAALAARRSLGIPDGAPIPPELMESAKQAGVEYLELHRPDLVKSLKVTPATRASLKERIALEL